MLVSCARKGGSVGRRETTYGVPAGKRVDVEECEDFIGFKELEGGDVACLFRAAVSIACSLVLCRHIAIEK